jgi:ubiquinone/menaquinone biosynthesis C-methylase UbiE
MLNLEKKHWDAIVEFQRIEIEKFTTDPLFAYFYGKLDHYSKIGEWAGAVSGNRVLEIGCGPGRYVAFLSSMGCDVVGVDPISYDTWPLIQRNHKTRFISQTYAENLPFSENIFDAVACLGALLYFDDPHRSLSEMRRVLRPGGDLIMRTVNRKNLYTRAWGKNIDPASKNVYTMSELIHLLKKNGFSINRKFSYGFYPPVMEKYWWYLVNGVVSLKAQRMLSKLTPSSCRVNHIVFAQRTESIS